MHGEVWTVRPRNAKAFLDFVLKYVVAAVAFRGLGYDVREFSPVLASALYLLALAVFFRGFWAWCNQGQKIVALYIAVGAAALFVVLLVRLQLDKRRMDPYLPVPRSNPRADRL